MLQLTEEAVTQAMLQQVWMISAKSQTKQANAGKQCCRIYDTALAQLHQQREIALHGRSSSQAAEEEVAGGSCENEGRLRSAAAGTEGKGGGGCIYHQGSPREGRDQDVCGQTINESTDAQTGLQACGGGDRCSDQGDQGTAEGRCGVGSATGDSGGVAGGDCTGGRCLGSRDVVDMGVNTVQHGEKAGPKQSVSRLHGTPGVLDQGGAHSFLENKSSVTKDKSKTSYKRLLYFIQAHNPQRVKT